MGNYCCLKRRQKNKIILLLLGLDNAGKTVAAKNLAGESVEEVVPTVGFSAINLSYMNFKVEIFDLGGGSNIRGIWNQYFVDAHGIIFVVDSSDYSRLNEVREVLHSLVNHEKVSGKPLLLLANKQDNENALDEVDLIESLQLESLVNKGQCPTLVESCSATANSSKLKLDPGIKKGYNWIINYIIREYDILNKRVKHDVEEQEVITAQTRQEIRERLQLLNQNTEKRKQDEDIIELYSDYSMKMNGIVSHGNHTTNDLIQKVRAKSATQIIKEQLEMKDNQYKLSSKKPSNKTEPANLLGVKLPHSAHVFRTTISNERRFLRSAGDSIFVISDMPNAVSYNIGDGDLHRQLFEVPRSQRDPRLSLKQNSFIIDKCTDDSINVVDVD